MSDPRFARLKTDPRFRRPKQKDLKVEIDDRFRDVLESEEFGGKGKGKGKASARVDKRGRPLAGSHHADQLKRFYRLRSPAEGEEGEGEGQAGFVDYARGGGDLQSSGSESEPESEVEEEELEVGGKRKSRLPGYVSSSDEEDDSEDDDHLNIDLSEDEDNQSAFPPESNDIPSDEDEEEEASVPATKRIAAVNLDWDNLRAEDLYAVFNSFLQASTNTKKAAAEGSKSASLGRLLNVKIYPSEFGKQRMEKEEQEGPGGGIFLSKYTDTKKNKGPKEGIIPRKRVEESEEEELEESADEEEDEAELDEGEQEGSIENDDDDDGEEFSSEEEEDFSEDAEDERLPKRSNDQRREEIDGLEIISDVASDAGSEDIDMDQLRQYQLERLRYFYAIATFSSVEASEYVMNECNGTEFERTANVMDLSYVPEGMDFADDEIRDEATKEPKAYKGNDFVTDALRHSKVKLTWDQDDPNRIKMTRRTLTREEIEEEDFNKLVAGSGSEVSLSSDEEQEVAEKSSKGVKTQGKDKKLSKAAKKERTEKLRNLLLAGNDEDGDIWGKAGTSWSDQLENIKNADDSKSAIKKNKKDDGMEITFKPALSTKLNENGDIDEENMTTLEKYQMRMKEKKSRKKEKLELRRATKAISDEEDEAAESGLKQKEKDDFFGSESEEEDRSKHEAEPETKPQSKGKVANGISTSKSKPNPIVEEKEDFSELVGTSDKPDTNFSMKDILKSEKEKKRRRRRGKKDINAEQREEEKELGPDGWKINVSDPRFKVIHEEAEFAIDPSNPHFTKTKAMQDLLTHRAQLRQKKSNEQPETIKSASGVKRVAPGEEDQKDLSDLVKSVKRQMEREGGKKRKRSRK
ncbi:uncharacterized protein IL334_003184 [Kwoniella shivajii]|uniref:NUC153 domain-containing protein n=1 Tax=Kwoniella shivajii TaxID=564305 RepID=A0ABZ1CZU4_9TREE|nr:hypothetical protein IL334_003184 [Kwoniella shivajii]